MLRTPPRVSDPGTGQRILGLGKAFPRKAQRKCKAFWVLRKVPEAFFLCQLQPEDCPLERPLMQGGPEAASLFVCITNGGCSFALQVSCVLRAFISPSLPRPS